MSEQAAPRSEAMTPEEVMRLGLAACHGGIKEIDFSGCADAKAKDMGKRSIALANKDFFSAPIF